jgi:hypothetical protein
LISIFGIKAAQVVLAMISPFLAFVFVEGRPLTLLLLGAASPGDLVGGKVSNAIEGNIYSAASHAILDAVYEYYNPTQGRAHFFARSNFDAIGIAS